MEHCQVFTCGDDEDATTRRARCDIGIRPTGGIGSDIQFQSQAFKTATDCLPNFGCVLADTGREDQCIDPTHCHRQGPNCLPNSMGVKVDGQSGPLVTFARGCQNLTHIGRDAGYAQEARFAIECRLDLFGG